MISSLISNIKFKLSIIINRYKRRKGPSLADKCAQVIMNVCSLQLQRTEVRQLAPTRGAIGPMVLSGGAIATVTYRVFDNRSDKVDRSIRNEPWRAFVQVTMRLGLESDPEFTVTVNTAEGDVIIEPKSVHTEPGYALINTLSQYFPLLPTPYQGPIFFPAEVV